MSYGCFLGRSVGGEGNIVAGSLNRPAGENSGDGFCVFGQQGRCGKGQSMEIKVTHNTAANRFETRVGDATAVLDYELKDGTLTLVHTKVPSSLEGQGIGGKVVKAALEVCAGRGPEGRPAMSLCPQLHRTAQGVRESALIVWQLVRGKCLFGILRAGIERWRLGRFETQI